MVNVKFTQIACQEALKQCCHKSVLMNKQKLKNIDLTSLGSTEKSGQSFFFSERFNWKEKAST